MFYTDANKIYVQCLNTLRIIRVKKILRRFIILYKNRFNKEILLYH